MPFDESGIGKGRAMKGQLSWDNAILDVNAAIEAVNGNGKVGFCMGGSVTWLAVARCPVDAAVGYYGGDIYAHRNEAPKCPIMLHFGSEDASIPLDSVAAIETMYPNIPVFVYEGAGHGFIPTCVEADSRRRSVPTAVIATASVAKREAIQPGCDRATTATLDCFATLAMTMLL